MTHYFYFEQKKNDPKNDQCQPGIVNGQCMQCIISKNKRDDTNYAWQDSAGIIKLEQNTEHSEQQQDISNVRITDNIQYLFYKAHLVSFNDDALCMQCFCS